MNSQNLGGRGPVSLALGEQGSQDRRLGELQESFVERRAVRLRVLTQRRAPGGERPLEITIGRMRSRALEDRWRREVFGTDRLTTGDDGRVLDRIAELADVAGPGPVAELFEHVVGELCFGHTRNRRLPQEMLGQGLDVFATLANGGMWIWNTLRRKNKSSRNSPAAISEPSGRLVAAITRILTDRGRASPTGVTSWCSIALSSLTWRLGATSPISSSSMVPPRELEQTLTILEGSGERPLQVPEELAFDQAWDESSQADRQERPASPRTMAVDRPGDELFAGSAFPGDQHRDVGRCDERDALEQILHGRRSADERLGLFG